MRLYSARLSLFARKVELALAEKGLPFERVLVPFNQKTGYTPKNPDVLAINPKGQVPVLVDGDLELYDSTVILEYLEDAYPHVALYPVAPAERARCRLFDLYADEVMLVPLRALMHRTGPRPADPSLWLEWEANAEQAAAVLAMQFSGLEAALQDNPYFCGAFGVADISIFMQVLYSQRLGGPGLAAHPKLRAWYRTLRMRPVFTNVIAEIAEADRELSAQVAGAQPDAE
ncbi:MAG: glutathione S-transferase family protein [Hyphomicrobiales bacterium]|nr:MAG: glutathione S-transferase family protein [Hyphomicrobiales bacterium]